MQNYTPLDITSNVPPPHAPKRSIGNRSKLAFLSALVIMVGVVSGYFLISNQVIFQNQAWETKQTAVAKCNANGKVDIEATFTNTEPDQPWQAMDVKVKDLQTGIQVDMGTVLPGGKSKTVTINTNKDSLNSGTVQFSLEWTQEARTDVDTRSAGYQAAGPCTAPTPTVTKTPTPTITPSPTPTPTPVPQCGSSCQTNANCITGTTCSSGKCVLNSCLVAGTVCDSTKCSVIPPTPTLTPTPTSCPVPSQVTNVKVTCPICEGN